MQGSVEVDGAHGEGGGQVLRLAVAMAASTGRAVRITSVRANRERPGLAAQHAAAVRAVASLCDARTEGVEVGSREVVLEPARAAGGDASVEVGTAGSVTLVLQAALAALAGGGPGPSRVEVGGGTDVIRAPTWDYMAHVLAPALRAMGVGLELECARRGFYPVGGGRVTARLAARRTSLVPITPVASRPARFEGAIVCSRLPDHVPTRIDHAMRKALVSHELVRISKVRVDAACPGVAATLWADLGGAVLGASMVGRRGLPSEAIGEALAKEVLADVAAGATVDGHLLDQLVPYAAMAEGTTVMRAREMSLHARTALDVCARFLPLDVELVEEVEERGEAGGLTAVRIGRG